MQLTDVIRQLGGLQSISRELGVSESEAATGAAALLPAILGGFRKQAPAADPNAGGMADMLRQLGGESLLDNVLSEHPTDVTRGNDVLGSIFGSKDVSRAVAQHASSQSGLDPAILRKMLPLLAMVVTGLMAKQRAGSASPEGGSGGLGGLGGLLGGLLGGGRGSGGGLGSMLDADGDGNPLDDILRKVGLPS